GVVWLPLLLLSAISGTALSGDVAVSFLHDVDAHVRFLIALPVLIAAEVTVHHRIRSVVTQFAERVVSSTDMPSFCQAIDSVLRLRNSVIAEVALLVAVYTPGVWGSQQEIAVLGEASWYATPDAGQLHLTPAGYWLAFVSVPIFQFILLRWYFRFILWFWLLWRVSRLDLRLTPIHPDRAAGLGFLGRSIDAFAPIAFAQSALLAGMIAGLILYAGRDLMAFKMEIAVVLVFLVATVLAPLTVFSPQLARARRQGLRDFSRLASRYVEEFQQKWIHGGAPADEAVLGSADIQSLADLGNSYSIVQEMRLVPFGLKDVTRLAAVAAIPLLPLTLTIFSLEELAGHLIKVLF
ncbi:MAG: hypothetical protein L0219_16155, partial [Phycisphaerales bacterium]|nr:hypothetical protein [Phycisphaerales bacterium]